MLYPQWLSENFENYRVLLKQFPHYSAAKPRWAWSFAYNTAIADQSVQTLKEKYHLDSLIQGDMQTI
jgi:hypothetical protein